MPVRGARTAGRAAAPSVAAASEEMVGNGAGPGAAAAGAWPGPEASAGWMRVSGGDPDMFLQAIEYDETQTYVRKIYEQYQVYAAIYGVN